MSIATVRRREVDPQILSALGNERPNLTLLELQLLAARGTTPQKSLPELLSTPMMDLVKGAQRIVEAIQAKQKIVVVADYDCDGATSCAVAVAGLRALGADIGYVVPHRMVHGYGISPAVVDYAKDRHPNVKLIMTVDNGVLGHSGISYAASLGIDVVVTDHHLPGDSLPSDAIAVIDPSRKDDTSGLQKVAGVGVSLWMVVAVKKALVAKGIETPNLNFLLPYVAIGTVADVVPLDAANRALVTLGLERMRTGQVTAGIAALIKVCGFPPPYMTSTDIGFAIAPRLNAAGRLESMETGIELLLATEPKRAKQLADLLNETNELRKKLQKDATVQADLSFELGAEPGAAIVRGDAEWHPGIVGLVASRIKEKYFRPTFIFSLADGVAKGSGRSIPGFHLKDAMEEVARRQPGILEKFGGHAMAAGATLTSPAALPLFEKFLCEVAQERITPYMLNNVLLSDGPMPELSLLDGARILRHPWGQGYEAPAFDDTAIIKNVRPLGKDGIHWKVEAAVGGRASTTTVVLFNQPEPKLNQECHIHMQPGLNTWNDSTSLQWMGTILDAA